MIVPTYVQEITVKSSIVYCKIVIVLLVKDARAMI